MLAQQLPLEIAASARAGIKLNLKPSDKWINAKMFIYQTTCVHMHINKLACAEKVAANGKIMFQIEKENCFWYAEL